VVDLFFEVIGTGPRLYLFGAGHVGQAVCRTLTGTPFTIHVVDERKEWIRSESIPKDVIRHECEWDAFAEEAEWSAERTYVAIMTHRHDVDQEIVAFAIKKPARYIGLIGSEAKWGRFQQRLTQRGVLETDLARVKSPIGIDIGGKAPQEVAISLAGELLGIHYGRA
jgi:xanthine dehydrogenase accessory factor